MLDWRDNDNLARVRAYRQLPAAGHDQGSGLYKLLRNIKFKWSLAIAAVLFGPIICGEAASSPVHIVVHADKAGATINRYVYGQFAEQLGRGIDGGIYVGQKSSISNTRGFRNDVLAALRDLHVPLVRWPGGCFAENYHWRDGVGPEGRRAKQVNYWGGTIENNRFGTHEYFGLLDLIGADAYVNANVNTGSPREASDWLEYMTGNRETTIASLRKANGHRKPWKVAVLGIGNEAWGCGGHVSANYYADQFNQFATAIHPQPEARPLLVAAGDNGNASGSTTEFTEVLAKRALPRLDAIAFHYYSTLENGKDTATGFGEAGWIEILASALKIDGMIQKLDAVLTSAENDAAKLRPDMPKKSVGLFIDEWGTWHKPTPGTNPGFLVQENTLRDTLVAAVSLNIFHKHADRVRMTAIAQMVNVLQAMIQTDGSKLLLTPTYYVYRMYRPFQDATSLPLEIDSGIYSYDKWAVAQVSASAARGKEGQILIALANLDPNRSADVEIALAGTANLEPAGELLTASAMDAHNSFAQTNLVRPVRFDAFKTDGKGIAAVLPPKSIVVLTFRPRKN